MSNLRCLDYAASQAPHLLPSRAAVLAALARQADDDGNMALSRPQLIALTGLSRTAVTEALRELEARGILTRRVQCTAAFGYVTNIYRFAALDARTTHGTALVRAVNL